MFKRIVEIWLSFISCSWVSLSCFSFALYFLISCCSIFKDHRLFAACFMRLIYYITFPCVCQGVLQKFFEFFSQALLLCRSLASRGCDLYIISHFQAFVKGFWESFLKSFSKPLGSLPLLARPVYYIILHRVCQEVLQKFFESFLQTLRPAFEKLSRWQLIYYSTFFTLCQAVFANFFWFVSIVHILFTQSAICVQFIHNPLISQNFFKTYFLCRDFLL